MQLFSLLLLLTTAGLIYAQTARQCTAACALQHTFPSDRPTPCCGCCPAGQCHEIPELTECCLPNQAFCGCLSFRAFCVGYIFNSTTAVNTFGTCYDPTNPATATCTYSPGPNRWVVCPANTTGCRSFNQFSCCPKGTTCVSTESDTLPKCVANPTTCTADWQCAQLGTTYGFSTCRNGFCQCRTTGFLGSSTSGDLCRCNAPSRVVYDTAGTPNCLAPGQCSAGGMNLRYLCSEFTENWNFIDCINGQCKCLPGFVGSATATDKCRCPRTVQWLPGGPVCPSA